MKIGGKCGICGESWTANPKLFEKGDINDFKVSHIIFINFDRWSILYWQKH